MRKLAILTAAATVFAVALSIGAFRADAAPFPVCPDQNETEWQSWGYTVDQQAWGNWIAATIAWDTPAAMSGAYTVKEDFLFEVDPSTCGLGASTCVDVYANDWWNHENADCSATVNGLGEFFDAGIINPNVVDGQYSLALDLPGEDWSVFYDANRNNVADGGDHNILEGTVLCYANVNGNLYAILEDDDGEYDGFFSVSSNEGMPDLLNGAFHTGSGQYPSGVINAAFASHDRGLFQKVIKSLVKQGVLTKDAGKTLSKCDMDHNEDG